MINQTSEIFVFRLANGMPKAMRYIELILARLYVDDRCRTK